ncbi:MAG: nuclear transport factor 2 family protein [Gammaproteobacteria bacterium]
MRKITELLILSSISPLVFAAENYSIVERFIEAFNQHDVSAMLELTESDLHWMSVAGQNLSIEASGQSELRDSMKAYFESTPSARSNILSIRESGPFVHTLEQAVWSAGGVERNQCSIAVYELEANKIRNVWYFPEHSCP